MILSEGAVVGATKSVEVEVAKTEIHESLNTQDKPMKLVVPDMPMAHENVELLQPGLEGINTRRTKNLQIAVGEKDLDMVRTLLAQGADTAIRDQLYLARGKIRLHSYSDGAPGRRSRNKCDSQRW